MKDKLNPDNTKEQMKTIANQTNINYFTDEHIHGTTEQRPPNPLEGFIRRNTTLDRFEVYVDGDWKEYPAPNSKLYYNHNNNNHNETNTMKTIKYTKMSEKMVCITYWSQETEESGRWVSTGTMKSKDAKIMLEKYRYLFPRGYVDEEVTLNPDNTKEQMKTPLQLNVKDLPFEIRDKEGRVIYYEDSFGMWEKREFDSDGNQIYYEDYFGVGLCKKHNNN